MNSRHLGVSFGIVLCATVGVGCIGDGEPPDSEDVASASEPIQGGQLETGFPSVGEVLSGGGLCSGTLIGPSWVLTAAHCAGSGMVFKTGNDASSFVSHVVDQQITHPTLDLLVAHLSAPIGGVPLIPINEGALPAVGEVCTAIGFGRHETGGVTTSGTKRSATEQVTAASSSQIVVQLVTGIADHGDSGGPLVCQGRIAAVVHGHSDGDWPAHMVETYTTIDAAWVMRNTPRALGVGALGTVPGATALAAYYADGDHMQHVIGGTYGGALTQYWYPGGGGIFGPAPLTNVAPEVALTGYYAPSDHYHHVISAGTDGTIREVFFQPGIGLGQGPLATVPGAVSLGAYYAPSDGYQHIMVGTSSGEVRELYFKPGSGLPVGSDTIGWVSGIISVSAYYAPSDGYQHVIVGTSGGQVYEFFFKPGQGVGQTLLTTVPGLVSVTGYYAASDGRQHVIAADASGTLFESWFTGLGGPAGHDILAYVPGTQRIAGYYGAADGFEHVIALSASGQLTEVFTRP